MEQADRRGHTDRRRGGLIAAVASIAGGAAVLVGAGAMLPLATAISVSMIALVWWSLLRTKPHVRRTELLASGGGAAALLWSIVFALPHAGRIFQGDGLARDSQGQLLELPSDLGPQVAQTDGLGWMDSMAAVGMLAALGTCLMGYGWRTLRRRRGRRRGRHAGEQQGGAVTTTTGEHAPITPAAPMERYRAAAGAESATEGQ